MTTDQVLFFSILLITVVLFVFSRFRHDIISLFALLSLVLLDIIPSEKAFTGFGHPAVITVAAILILSAAIQKSGAVNGLAGRVIPKNAGLTTTMLILTFTAAILSGFMNNVGAMALMIPITLQIAKRYDVTPGVFLMPVSFASIIGGMTTLIGTPPNLIVSGFREGELNSSFNMFDFAPVGILVTIAGVLFIGFIGWRLVPKRKQGHNNYFDAAIYLAEVYVGSSCTFKDKSLKELNDSLENEDAQIITLIRGDLRLNTPHGKRVLREGDILVLESDPESLGQILSKYSLKLARPNKNLPDVKVNKEIEEKAASAKEGELKLKEFVVMTESSLVGRTASSLQTRERYGISLVALSRQGRHKVKRVTKSKIRAGDVLLIQGEEESLSNFSNDFECIPLAERDIQLPNKRKSILSVLFMLIAIGGAAFGLIPAAVSFSIGVLGVLLFEVVPLRRVYSSVDWPVIVLLAAMIPVAEAMLDTGSADLIATFLKDSLSGKSPVFALTVLMIITMMLSDIMNNAATAAVMCPIAVSLAQVLGVNSDAFLMAVAVGASCAFLTPIGHQNNTIILGPGGFKFGDYWKLGIVVEIIVVLVAVPALTYFWPL